MRFLVLLLFSLSATNITYAQLSNLSFRHITRSSGLPVDEVTALAQDSSGFIWIGSRDGLYKYDGFTFKAFYAVPNDPKSIPSNEIAKIYVAPTGRLWIATVKGGIVSMTSEGRVLQTFNSTTSPLFTLQADYITDVKEDKSGNAWWTTVEGLFCLSPSGKLQCFKLITTQPRGNSFNSFFIDEKNRMWVSGLLGLFIFDPVTRSFSKPHFIASAMHRRDYGPVLFTGSKLWYSSWMPDLGVYDTAEKKETLFYSGKGRPKPDYNRMARSFFTDSKGLLWIGTGNGLYAALPHNPVLSQHYVHEPQNPHSIISNEINTVLEDREGNMWLGTKEGISITQPYRQPFYNVSVNAISSTPFGNKVVKDVIEIDSSQLLVGTHYADGLYLTNDSFKVLKHFSFNHVGYDWIWTHYRDKARSRFLISAQEGLLQWDSNGLQKNKTPALNHRYPISSFAATSDSILWISRFRNSFLRYNLKTNTHKEYSLEALGEKQQVLYLAKDNQNNIWLIAHNAGLLLFDEASGTIKKRLEPRAGGKGLLHSHIRFFLDIGTYFLIGYDTKGISLYHKQNDTWQHFTKNEGLCANSTRAAVLSKDGTVWIATANGLSQFDPASKRFATYNYDYGILSNDFVSISALSDGRIIAGSTRGLVAFHPHQLNKASLPLPPPIVTAISVHGSTLSVDSLRIAGPLVIAHNQNNLSVDFISPYYTAPTQVEYAYKIEGLQPEWIGTGQRHHISMNGIKGGNYTLHLRARLPDGEWVECKTPLHFTVGMPFYSQWWFFILCFLAFTGIFYALFRFRLQQAVRLERMRTAISSDLHDEVGASLTSISLFSEMARADTLPTLKKEEYLQRIGERSRDSIEKMGDIIWSINPENDSLQQMLVRMKNYATEIADAKDIALHWKENGNLLGSRFSMEQRKNVYLFFKEAMNNAVKHSGALNIYLELTAAPHTITIIIKDDGKGFELTQKNEGNGLKTMQRRAALLHSTIHIDTAPGRGCTVTLHCAFNGK